MSRRDKQTFDRLYDLFSEEANFEELRKHVDQLAFSPVKDCIPYLGIYLTDLTYIGKLHLTLLHRCLDLDLNDLNTRRYF